jgi:hypothetical protein
MNLTEELSTRIGNHEYMYVVLDRSVYISVTKRM